MMRHESVALRDDEIRERRNEERMREEMADHAEHYGPRAEPVRRAGPKVGRNDRCPCGSGLKFKQCCLRAEQSG